MNLRFSEDSSILCFVARADGVWGSAALACVWAAAVFGQPRRWRLGSAVLGQRRVDGVSAALVSRGASIETLGSPALRAFELASVLQALARYSS